MQTGFSEPVALSLEGDAETLNAASGAGFRCFTTPEAIRAYIEASILVEDSEPILVG